MVEIVTYVEMTAPDQLRPATPVPGLSLSQVDRGSPLVPGVLARIGAPYGWKRARWTEREWAEWFPGHPARMFWILWLAQEPAGMVCYEPRPDGQMEIETFGLLPEFVGRGLGGFALTLAVKQAWDFPSVTRVWLHTSTHDHARALPNYHRRGFRTFKTVEGDRPTPEGTASPAGQ